MKETNAVAAGPISADMHATNMTETTSNESLQSPTTSSALMQNLAPLPVHDHPSVADTDAKNMTETTSNESSQSPTTSSALMQNMAPLPGLDHPSVGLISIAEISHQKSPKFFEQYSFVSDQPIGRGKNSICMRCKINATDDECAVKILRSSPEVDVEIHALSACAGHPNIVEILDVIKDNHFVFIVTELLAGELLNSYIKRNRSLDECSSRKIFNQIARALSHIHSKQIVHRNLEPNNIKLSSDGNVKIFGFSSAAEMILDRQKKPRKLIVSLFNVPPETLKKKVFKKEADVWCLGVILFKLLFGFHPYNRSTNDTIDEVQNRIMSCNIQLDYNRKPPISPSAIDLIKRLLMPDCTQRIQSNEVIEHYWCSPGKNETITSFLNETGTLQQLEELSSTQRAELIQKLQSIDEKNSPSTPSTNKLGDSPQMVYEENVTIPSILGASGLDFECHICSKKFKTKRILDSHKKIHLNLTYKCEEEDCKRQFSTRGKLSSHIKSTHNRKISTSEREGKKGADAKEKLISCEICGTKFSQTWILKRHIKSMHSPTTFECYLCQKAFGRFDCLRHHLQSKHLNIL